MAARSATGTVRQLLYSSAERATASRTSWSEAVSNSLTVSPVAGLIVA